MITLQPVPDYFLSHSSFSLFSSPKNQIIGLQLREVKRPSLCLCSLQLCIPTEWHVTSKRAKLEWVIRVIGVMSFFLSIMIPSEKCERLIFFYYTVPYTLKSSNELAKGIILSIWYLSSSHCSCQKSLELFLFVCVCSGLNRKSFRFSSCQLNSPHS